jgi:hypothetical protein
MEPGLAGRWHAGAARFFGPEVAVIDERIAIHEERARMREMLAEAAQDGETVRLEVTPIVQGMV